MNIENARSQMRKGMLEYCILLILKRGQSYASDIISQLEKADMMVVEGTVYPLLSRLKKDEMLGYEWQESTQGPPRKYYFLTEKGEEYFRCMDAAWSELAKTIGILKSDVALLPESSNL